ncbi:hypothetical protein EOW65_06250 [Sinirhodobacter ferrireducens]|uniref:YHYH domain-containing protein n=1 Tax=Paenirhodobacter ferrireducens TaxID=1215032 RepID=A0A443LMY5_9RHOB|nr:hypothetical protein [Sinirhodobacter ferrireducens]RWR50554.1 hypothetical protein EOW65_06250 [Sinirhodobacter ferrireducens]
MIRFAFAFALMLASAAAAQPVGLIHLTVRPEAAGTPVAHGGGCRKSSPPGQCCHMDRKAGRVHCH